LETHRDQISNTRIDAPHALPARAAEAEAKSAFSAVTSGQTSAAGQLSALPPCKEHSSSNAEQLQRQAEQLSDSLEKRQRGLDRREAELNAQAAQLEQAVRSARLWAEQKQQDLLEREDKVHVREDELDARQLQIATQQEQCRQEVRDLQTHQARLDEVARQLANQQTAQEAAFADLEQQRGDFQRQVRLERQKIDRRRTASLELVRLLMAGLVRRRAAIERRAARVQQSGQEGSIPSAGQTIAQREERLYDWEYQLAQQEAELARQQSQHAVQRAELTQRREAFEKQRGVWQSQRQKDQRQHRLRERRRHEHLRQRGRQLDDREAALLRLRDEVARMHRQTLELRIVTEELWTRLVATVDPATLVKSIGELRRQLSDQFRIATDEIATRRAELSELQKQTVSVQQSFHEQRRQLEAWFHRRRHELDRQAADLNARRQKLALQAERCDDREQAWQQERTELEAQLHRLRSQRRLGHIAAYSGEPI